MTHVHRPLASDSIVAAIFFGNALFDRLAHRGKVRCPPDAEADLLFVVVLLRQPGPGFHLMPPRRQDKIEGLVDVVIGQQGRVIALTQRWITQHRVGFLDAIEPRVLHGHVVDFLLLHVGDRTLFVFNLADAALTLGPAILIVVYLFVGRGRGDAAA